MQRRETIPSHLAGNGPVSPPNPQRANQWNHMQLSQHTSHLSGADQAGKDTDAGRHRARRRHPRRVLSAFLFLWKERCCVDVEHLSRSGDSCIWLWEWGTQCSPLCSKSKYINKCAACHFHRGFPHYRGEDFFFL